MVRLRLLDRHALRNLFFGFFGVTLFVVFALLVWVPSAFGASYIVPCGNDIKHTDNGQYIVYTGECDVCDLSKLGANILSFLILILVVVAAILFVNAGVLYLMSSANPGNIARAHKIFTSALIGLVIVLAAYLLIDVLMKTLLGGDQLSEGRIGDYGPWNEILCMNDADGYMIKKLTTIELDSSSISLPAPTATTTIDGLTGWTPPANDGTLPAQMLILTKCPPASSGFCTISNLYSYFGDKAGIAAGICYRESSNQNKPSTCDACTNYSPEKPFSFGYFQVNIRANYLPGLSCPSAFTNYSYAPSCAYTCTISNETLYNSCVTAALDPTTNVQKAMSLSKAGTDWSCWSTSFASECDAPRYDGVCSAPGDTSAGSTALVNL